MTSAHENLRWYLAMRRNDDYLPLKYDMTLAFTALDHAQGSTRRDVILQRFRAMPVTEDERSLLEIIIGRGVWSADIEQMTRLVSIPTSHWRNENDFRERYSEVSDAIQENTVSNVRQVGQWVDEGKLLLELPEWIVDFAQQPERQAPFPVLTDKSEARLRIHELRSILRHVSHQSITSVNTTPDHSWLSLDTFERVTAEEILDSPTDYFAKIWLAQASAPALQPIIIPRSTKTRQTGALQLLGFRAPDTTDLKALCRGHVSRKVAVYDMDLNKEASMTPATFAQRFEERPPNVAGIWDNPRAMLLWEVSHSAIKPDLKAPDFVVKHDWKSRFTERDSRLGFIQLVEADYCTSWHIDTSGTSQYFYVSRGVKHLFLVDPTKENLKSFYESEDQGIEWDVRLLGVRVHFVRLVEGEAIILPGGWIHAVYTPVNACVVSGNFLHDYNMPIQLAMLQRELLGKKNPDGKEDLDASLLFNQIRLLVEVSEDLHRRFALLAGRDASASSAAPLPHPTHIRQLAKFLEGLLDNPVCRRRKLIEDRNKLHLAVQALRDDLDKQSATEMEVD